jgi:4-amino-4-deoxy-L-arabinose transferase-like glycosyltransferase
MSKVAAGRAVVAIIVGSALVRIWLSAITGLGFDESYMVGNARQLMLGYVDHPPLHAWIAWLAQTLAGNDAAVVVRLPFILLFAGSTWLMFRLTARLFGAAAGVWSVIVFNIAPVFSLAHASWVLPDGPLIFFLLAAANAVARILFDDTPPARPVLWWVAAGAFGGLALLSKYTAAFFFVGVLVYLVSMPSARRQLATAGPWLGVVAALVVFSPAIVWNAEHGFAGFIFQGGRIANPSPDVVRLLQEIGGQLLYLTPWLGVPLAISLLTALRAGRADGKGWLLALLAIGPIAVFTVLALFARSLPHWSMPGWLFAIPLFGRDAVALAARRPVFARGYMAAATAVFVILLAAFAVQATRGGLVAGAVVAANPAADPTTDLIDWRDLRVALDERGLAGPDLVVASTHWLYAGKASYALGPGVPVLCLCANQQQFAFRADRTAWAGRDVVVVLPAHAGEGWSAAAAYFESLEDLEPIAITRGGVTALTLQPKLGRNLRFP